MEKLTKAEVIEEVLMSHRNVAIQEIANTKLISKVVEAHGLVRPDEMTDEEYDKQYEAHMQQVEKKLEREYTKLENAEEALRDVESFI